MKHPGLSHNGESITFAFAVQRLDHLLADKWVQTVKQYEQSFLDLIVMAYRYGLLVMAYIVVAYIVVAYIGTASNGTNRAFWTLG